METVLWLQQMALLLSITLACFAHGLKCKSRSLFTISADNHFSMSSMAELRGAGAWQDTKHHTCSSQDLTFVHYWSPVCDADPLEMIVKVSVYLSAHANHTDHTDNAQLTVTWQSKSAPLVIID